MSNPAALIIRGVVMRVWHAARRRIALAELSLLRISRANFFLGKYGRDRRSRKTAKGVNLIAYIRAEMGLGEAGRGMATALEAAQIPFKVTNFELKNPSRHGDMSWSHKEVKAPDYDISILSINFDNALNAYARLPGTLFRNRYVIGHWIWELPEFPDEYLSSFSILNEVWVPTHFAWDAIAKKSPVPVTVIPYVVQVSISEEHSRDYFGLPDDCFLFLAMFDNNSVLERKNPLGVVEAYKKAFPVASDDVGLVLKFNNPNPEHEVLKAIATELRGRTDIRIIERVFTRQEVNSLINTIDCFVSLHRAEGFGLGPAEAMYLGKPTIMTNWSGNTDFMDEHNSAAIDYQLVRIGQDYGLYKSQQYWAEADTDHAASWMKRLYDNPSLATSLGERGRATMRSQFSPERVSSLVKERLDYIRLNVR